MNILLVSPATPATFWSFKHLMGLLSRKAAFPPLGLLTIAAMLPDRWSMRLIDRNVSALTQADIEWADYVLISAMIIHADAAHEIIDRCIEAGKTVIAGGPLFTSSPERFPQLKHIVFGEAEDIIPELVADMESGELKPSYRAEGRPDITRTPPPRWDLINIKNYLIMPVQFSRGCPFDCEFCDITVMNGRNPRTKAPSQLIHELDTLRDAGWRGSIFIVDDNFIGNKVKSKVMLHELIAWRRKHDFRAPMITEASLNLVDDQELLTLMSEAGFKSIFVGIETPSEAGLLECAKVQNTKRDLVAAVKVIQNHGMEVMGGFIVGFDSDQPDIFDQQIRFIQESGIATAMIGILGALPGTRLFARLKSEDRLLIDISTGNNVEGKLNFIPKLDPDVLINGYRTMVQKLYAPQDHYACILQFLSEYRPIGARPLPCRRDLTGWIKSIWLLGVRTRQPLEYWKFVARVLLKHRESFPEAMQLAIMGHHFRTVAATV